MKKILIAITAMLFVALPVSAAFANCGVCAVADSETKGAVGDLAGEEIEEGEVINDICPVMGGKIDKDTPYKTVYKGETIGLCCSSCVAKFKADPEKYMKKLKNNNFIIKCPECGAKIDLKEQCKKGTCPMM